LVGINNHPTSWFGSRHLQVSLPHALVEIYSQDIQAVAATAMSPPGKAYLHIHIQEQGQVWFQAAGSKLHQGLERFKIALISISLVSHGRVSIAIANDHASPGKMRPDNLFDQLRT